MIKAKHENQYKQVGFIKVRQPDGTYKDVDKKYAKINGGYGLVFEKGFTRSKEGVLPLVIDGIGKPLKDYGIYGNIYQSDGVSPDTPQEIMGCGDRTGNLINIIPFKATFATGSAVIRDFLNSLDVGAYVVSYNIELLTRNDTTDNSFYGIRVLNESGNFELTPSWSSASIGTVKKTSLTITITEDNKGKFTNVYFYGCGIFSVGDTGSAQIYDFMLNAGSTPLPYEPYGYKADVVTRGKNLWYLQSSYSFTTYYDINVNINAGHYLSYIIETNGTTDVQGGTGCQLTFSDNTTQYVFFNATYRKSILLSKDVKIVRVYAGKDYNTSVGFTATVSEIMVSANADDSYEPYTPPSTTPIYLDSPLYKIGDYSDSIGMTEEVRAVKELVLTGEEDWRRLEVSLGTYELRFSDANRTENIVTLKCSHYISQKNVKYYKNLAEETCCFRSDIAHLWIKDNNIATVEAWKSYLAAQYANGTPIKVYYVLATPETKTVEPVEIPTLNGTTVIDVDTEVKPSNVYIKYKSKT